MFNRFTDRARKSMGLARQAALKHHHDYIAPEHMLLGLLETHGVAADVLKAFKVKPQKLAAAVEKRLPAGGPMLTAGQLPFTPNGKRVLERGLKEANALGHNYIGTEHLLLGLVRDAGHAGVVLREAGLAEEPARRRVAELLGGEDPVATERSSTLVLASNRTVADEVVRPALAAAGCQNVRIVNPVGFDSARLEFQCAAAGLAVVVEPDSPELVYAAGLCRGARTPTILFSAGGPSSPFASLPVVSTGDELRDILKEP